ncbi:hypothetical protein Tco_0478038 [Tanacetum coccineum]
MINSFRGEKQALVFYKLDRDVIKLSSYMELTIPIRVRVALTRGSCEPDNYKAALSYPKFDKWLKAMNAKIQSMKDNEVWSLVDVPPNVKTIRSKKLFKKKTGMDDNVNTYKSHFVAKEAEYIAGSQAAMEAVWISKFIDGLGVVSTNKEPMEMYYDNYGALIIANEHGVQRCAKHYRRKVHYIREVIKECDINLLKVHIDYNIADPFTKALPCTKHVNHARIIGLLPASSLM